MRDRVDGAAVPRRARLPNRRLSLTQPIDDAATGKWWLAVGFDAEGVVRELFLDRAHRAGSELDALVHDVCIIVSRELLQRGRRCAELGGNLSARPPSLFARALAVAAELEAEIGPSMVGAAAPHQSRAATHGGETNGSTE